MANGNYKEVMDRFRRRVKEEPVAVIRHVAEEMSDRVIHRTPVDTGEARGNWRPAINAIDQQHDPNSLDQSGDVQTAQAKAAAEQMKLGDVFSLANSTPYIGQLEYEAKSGQAPNGFLGITVAEFPLIVEEAARRRRP